MSRYCSKSTYELSEDTAYLAGLIASDGCLYKDKRHINLTSKDIELLEYLNAILNKNYKITEKIGGYGTISNQINFSNTGLYDFLVDLGIHNAKSKTLGCLDIQKAYYHHFLRGYFDGDGSIYGYQDSRWKNSFMYYTNFASASKEFLIWLQKSNTDYFGTTSGIIKQGKRVFILTYSKGDSRNILSNMYSENPKYKLLRKYQRWIDYLCLDSYSKV